MKTNKDIIEGESSNGYSAGQMRAISLVVKIGEELAKEHPEIAELYRDGTGFQRCRDIAEEYIPCAREHPVIAEKAVAYALRKLIGEDERRNIASTRSAERLEERYGGFNSKAFSDHCRNAARQRHEKFGSDIDAMIKGRGQVRWCEDEKDDVSRLVLDSAFIRKSRANKGMPDYPLIAEYLNTHYHGGSPVRSGNSVSCYLRDLRRKARK